jgi:hypothetical protein
MFEIFDLNRDFSGFQTGFAMLPFLHQVIDSGIKNPKLTTHFPQLISDGAVALDLGQIVLPWSGLKIADRLDRFWTGPDHLSSLRSTNSKPQSGP